MIGKRFVVNILLVFVLCTNVLYSQSRHPVIAENGMVVSTQQLASGVGADILQQGGNAIDAAVATAFALAVTYPGAGNIGGGGFLVYCTHDGNVTSIDFREKAPLAATQDMYLDEQGNIRDNTNHDGILSVGVPGTVAGLELAHRKYGNLPWAQLVAPAIELARDGYVVSHNLANELENMRDDFLQYPSSIRAFLKSDSTVYQPGDTLRQPDLAATLLRIKKFGSDDFYRGQTAAMLAAYMEKHNGLITLEDLAAYQAIERQPVQGTFRGYDVYSMGMPSSGGASIIQMLNILEDYDLAALGHNSAAYLHLLTEAMRLAFFDRARYLGDSDFNPDLPLDRLLSKDYADQQRKSIRMDTCMNMSVNDIKQLPDHPHTTHFSVIDAKGNAVSLTYTIEAWYGSAMVVEGAGFLLNNEMGDFNPIPGVTTTSGLIGTPPNLIAPEKRMLSSMSPTIVVKDNKPYLIIGSPGGRTIINTVLQVILNVMDFDMNIAEAIAARRIHHQWMPDVTTVESGALNADSQSLYQQRGHQIRNRRSMGEAMGILVDSENGRYTGAADPRSPDGGAVGY